MGFNFEEERKQIIDDLIEQGYNEKVIGYSEFLRLYEKYKNIMSEKEFALVLGISIDGSFQSMKYHGVKCKILVKSEISIEREEEVKQNLLKDGWANKKIDYSKFLEIYKPYMSEINEVTFAKILGINYTALRNLKNKNTQTIILRMPAIEPTIERSEEIRRELLKKWKQNSSITYNEFIALYQPYKDEMTEVQFASVLDISANTLSQIKSVTSKKAIILKRPKLTEKRKQEIKQILISNDQKQINYQSFQELFEPYRQEMTERMFAHEILGIPYRTFSNMKSKGKKAKIAVKNDGKLTDELKDEIYSYVREKGYAGKRITYDEFLKLYEKYKNELSEREFSNAIGISEDSFEKMKSQVQRATVYKKEENEVIPENISVKRKREILEEIKQKTSPKSIKYDEFFILYEPYQNEISETEFAYLLGISENRFDGFKRYKTSSAQILNREYIEDEIKVKGIEDGTYLDYAAFLDLYKEYKHVMTEKSFAERLGIEYQNYWRMKKGICRTRVNLDLKLRKRIVYLFSQSKFYEMNDFDEVCKKYGCSLKYIINILYGGNSDYVEAMLGIITKEGKAFIGDKKISDDYIGDLTQIAHRYSKSLGRIFNTQLYSEDIAQDILSKVALKRGDMFENFSVDMAMRLLRRYMWVAMKHEHIKKLSKISYVSINDECYTNWRSQEDATFIENVVEEYIQEDTTPVQGIQICLQNGMNRDEALEYVIKRYHLSKDELLKLILGEIEKKNKLQYTNDGKVYLGEEVE